WSRGNRRAQGRRAPGRALRQARAVRADAGCRSTAALLLQPSEPATQSVDRAPLDFGKVLMDSQSASLEDAGLELCRRLPAGTATIDGDAKFRHWGGSFVRTGRSGPEVWFSGGSGIRPGRLSFGRVTRRHVSLAGATKRPHVRRVG